MFDHLPVADRLALLDPDAYDYYYGSPWDLTVPAGETWYALNIWWATINGVPWCFHRKLDAFDPYILPAGTNIKQPAENLAFAYICRPSKVAVPCNPEDVLAARLAALRTMPLYLTRATVAAGQPITTGWIGGALWESSYPPSFSKGMLRHTATHDGSWMALAGNGIGGGLTNVMNTLDENSDFHAIRFTGNVLCPFRTAVWNGLWIKAGNPQGDPAQPSMLGSGVATFNKLPAAW